MADKRFYKAMMVDGSKRLIEAANPAQVNRHIAAKLVVSVAPATSRDMAELFAAKVEIEQAGDA